MILNGIIFDLDGTLADTLPVCIRAHQETIGNFTGRIPSEAEIIARFGPNEEGMLEYFIPGRLAETLPFFLEAYERAHTICQEPFPGVDRLLSILQARGIRAAIVTGKGRYSAEISLRILGLQRWIQTVEVGFFEKADKPRSIRTVLEGWGIPPTQAGYVGDTPYDMQAARIAGLLPLGATWAQTATITPEQTDLIFSDIDSFIHWIEA